MTHWYGRPRSIPIELIEVKNVVDPDSGTFSTALAAVALAVKHHEAALKGITRRGWSTATDAAVGRHTRAMKDLDELRDALYAARNEQLARTNDCPAQPARNPRP